MPARLTIADVQKLARSRGGRCLSREYAVCRKPLEWQCAKGHNWRTSELSVRRGSWCPYCAGVARKTIGQMRELALAKGGRCLSRRYVNGRTPLSWRCRRGHRWEMMPMYVAQGQWCPTCAHGPKISIAEWRKLARSLGGKCLSKQYTSKRDKLLWQCAKGHRWEAVPNQIKQGGWCPDCAGSRKHTLADMGQLAAQRGGQCLSQKYVNNHSALKWRCAKGHVWKAEPRLIGQGHWCPACHGTPKGTLQQMRELAQERGGRCASKTYLGSQGKLVWRCAVGHLWEATPATIKAGRWCPHCAHKARLTIKEMRELAEARGGRCLSQHYVNSYTKLLWECANGHIWATKPATVRRGHWCPVCAGGWG